MLRAVAPAWVSRWVGLPFAEKGRGPAFDCWGLVRAVLIERAGLELPSFTDEYASTLDREAIALIVAGQEAGPWRAIEATQARELDVVKLRARSPHIGLVIAPGLFLHVQEDRASSIDRWDGPWWNRRVLGFVRHEELARPCSPSARPPTLA